MATKFNTAIKVTAVLGLVLFVALSTAWAVETYIASKIIRKGGTSDRLITVADTAEGSVNFRIKAGALDDYLTEQGKGRVKITVDMMKDEENGVLLFTFGPSGAHFDPPAKLKLRGEFIMGDYLLLDENGEILECTAAPKKDLVVFEIPHFSSYYYDDYDY